MYYDDSKEDGPSPWEDVVICVLAAVLLVLVLCNNVQSAHKVEKDYQRAFCDAAHGKMEVRLDDAARIDCLTDEYAIEVDYGPQKFYEGISQALYYGLKTHKRPGLLLIDVPNSIYVKRTIAIITGYKLDITLWVVNPQDVNDWHLIYEPKK